MNDTKWIQGAWQVFITAGDSVEITADSDGKTIIADLTGLWGEDDVVANAHLIAAAPDLYAALESVVALSDRKTDVWDRAHAALAKARGEQ